jgi:hypothetical protein
VESGKFKVESSKLGSSKFKGLEGNKFKAEKFKVGELKV